MIAKFFGALCLFQAVLAAQIPGLVPKNYEKGQTIDILVDGLSTERSSFTLDYYSLNWCDNNKGRSYDGTVDQQAHWGAPKLHESPFDHKFGFDRNIEICKKTLTHSEVENFSGKMQQGFQYYLYLDGLPSATILRDKQDKELPADYFHGIPIGKFEGFGSIMLYNHWDIIVIVHDTIEGHHRIVGFEVEPYSMAEGPNRSTNNPATVLDNLYIKGGEEFTFSYRIITRRDPKTSWSMRLDHYTKTANNNIHMANIFYALCVMLFVIAVLSFILKRGLDRDFKALELIGIKRKEQRQNRRGNDTSEEDMGLTSNKQKMPIQAADVAWKKLQGDVFRKPEFPVVLCILVGTGVQILCGILTTLFLMSVSTINQQNRWWTVIQASFLFLGGGFLNGFTSARAMKYFGSDEWRFAASAACIVLPMFLLTLISIVDFIDWIEMSAEAMPFSSVLLYVFLWAIFDIPACYFGAYNGWTLKGTNAGQLFKVSHVHRVIPEQPWYLSFIFGTVLPSLLIFSCFMGEFHFVLTSVWRSYMMGAFIFAFINVNILCCITAIVSISITYQRLNAGNWKWWWPSYFLGMSVGVWMFLYIFFTMVTEFNMTVSGFASNAVFMLYNFAFSIVFGTMCAAISVFFSWLFVTYLYMQSKSD